jgi:endonuclease YncB( thermonuclease family)
MGAIGWAVAAIVVAAVAFILISALGDLSPERHEVSAGSRFPCTVVGVADGDGPIDCEELDTNDRRITVRLRGIDAREEDNSCQYVGNCTDATGEQAKAALTRIAVGRLQCESFGPSYDRVDSSCVNAEGVNLSCEMVRTGMAARWPQYDPEGRLAGCVPRRP